MSRQPALLCGFVLFVLMAAMPRAADAQVDPSGGWATRQHEDQPERGGGPHIGEFQGLPINDANRARGEAWSSSLWTVPEHQCIPHPADYGPSFSNLKIWHDVDPVTQAIVAYHTQMAWMTPVRTIWMDGRPHPSEWAPHTWQGFSTGRWEGDMLVVTTTHLKPAYVRRNGIARSEKAVLHERFTRAGDVLTWISIVDDPAYLTEPLIRSRNFVYEPGYQAAPYPCTVEVEIPGDQTAIPHYLPGTNPYLNEFAARYRIPEAARSGGAETMYPEYMDKLRTLPPAVHEPPAAATAGVSASGGAR
ncbi:MAG: hypothetical protein HY657_02840 [Acidobacteria bacterium]|nr:hypothetical protein [Acidobacteriota bacterium]